MPKKPDIVTITDELLKEELEIMQELFDEEIRPLIDYRIQMERSISDKAIREMYEAEEEA